jgi:hypothetical protein
MSREWVLEVKTDPSNPRGVAVCLGLKEAATGRIIRMTPACGSLHDLNAEVNTMKAELDEALDEARKKLEPAGEALAPDAVWRKMQSTATEAQMFEYFNSLSATERQRVAEHIFSHANMFKGRGPVFSERYDHSSNKLE